jgi:hypothetical protein
MATSSINVEVPGFIQDGAVGIVSRNRTISSTLLVGNCVVQTGKEVPLPLGN